MRAVTDEELINEGMTAAFKLVDAGLALASKTVLQRDSYENELVLKLFGNNVPLDPVKRAP
jgi:hypothetical protein